MSLKKLMLFEARKPSQDHACPVYNHTQVAPARSELFSSAYPVNPPDIAARPSKGSFLVARNTRC